MDSQKLERLFKRYLQNQSSPEEIKLLFQYFQSGESEEILKNLIRTELESTQDMDIQTNPKTRESLEQIFRNIKKAIRKSN